MVTVPRRVEDETTSARLRRWAIECRQVARVLVSRSDGSKTGQIYDIIGTQNLYGEESLFINLNASDIVVDCGPGYADQDILWVNEFGVKHITGVNVATAQIAISTRRVEEARLADRIDYVHASATSLSQAHESCTKVSRWNRLFTSRRVDYFSAALRVSNLAAGW